MNTPKFAKICKLGKQNLVFIYLFTLFFFLSNLFLLLIKFICSELPYILAKGQTGPKLLT